MNFCWVGRDSVEPNFYLNAGGRNEAAEMLFTGIRRSPSPRPSPHGSIGTSNAEHRMAARILVHFDVRCSMLDVRCFPSVQGFERVNFARQRRMIHPLLGERAGVRASVSSKGYSKARLVRAEVLFRLRLLARHGFEAGGGEAARDELAHDGNLALLQQRNSFDREIGRAHV